jgi:hypothetical protein
MIDVYVATASTPIDSLWTSGCGILLVYNDKQQQRHRYLSFGLDLVNSSTARIQVVLLALLAINHVYRRTKIIIHLPDYELLSQLSNPTEGHTELIRRYSFFTDIGFLVETPDDQFIRACQKLAQAACDSQTLTDSLTQDGPPTYGQD